MKTILITITLMAAAVGLISCTGVYTDPSYPVVSTGRSIHQSHHHYRRHHHYNHRRVASAPKVYVGGGSSISQSHY